MTEDFFVKEGNKLVKAMPVYLGIQAITLLMTFLDSPNYMKAYLANQFMTVSGWLGAWFVLAVFGFSMGAILLIGKAWKLVLLERERATLAAGYFAGAIAGLLTLGLRFMAIMPAEYFIAIGGLVLVLVIGYFVWVKRQPRVEEIFP